jgi:hypothetical protein
MAINTDTFYSNLLNFRTKPYLDIISREILDILSYPSLNNYTNNNIINKELTKT